MEYLEIGGVGIAVIPDPEWSDAFRSIDFFDRKIRRKSDLYLSVG